MTLRGADHATSVINRMAIFIAIIVAISLPAGYAWTSLTSAAAALEFKAKVKAASLNGLISSSPDIWMLAENRIQGLISREPVPLAEEHIQIIDAQGNLIVQSGFPPIAPVLSQAYSLFDAGQPVGQVIVSGSQRELVLNTMLVTLFGIFLGGLVFVIMRVLPLRALRRTTMALRTEKEHAEAMVIELADHRNHLEELVMARTADLRVAAAAFDSQEAMMVTDANCVILRVNSAFSQATGYSEVEAIGQNPNLLKSDRHGPEFFRVLWETIERSGGWHGEIWDRRKNGEVFPTWMTITALRDDQGAVTNYIGVLRDITQSKLAEDEIRNLAFFDHLTGLPNRRLLADRLKQVIATSTRSKKYGALLFLDLDNFKVLNDTQGHEVGDQLLKQVAQRLSLCIREGDTVARLGGDEFVVILDDLSQHAQEAAAQTEIVGEKVMGALNQPYQLGGIAHTSTPSIGITLFVDHDGTIDDLLKRADLAMYQAKAAGRNTLRFFDPAMQAVVTQRAELETGLREALLKDQFLLHYQSQVDSTGRIIGAEALLRWQHPDQGIMSPAGFIPFAEESGLIIPIGKWVLQTACSQLTQWAARPDLAHLTIAVNISARQLKRPNFVADVIAVIRESGANANQLKLELTESLILDDVEDVIAKMAKLKDHGVNFSLDDFGTGYSSLTYLKRLPLDQLKIDQGFVRNIVSDLNDAAIAKMVIALAETLELSVIAEGVETSEQRDVLARHGCFSYQGYLYGRPMPVAEFEASVTLV
jgi:diguanylate cyclase (GGDEF)-like protein/PAS domain S-box-containing protein